MEGLKVKCGGCGKALHETTSQYDPDITPHGAMLRLVEPWKGWRWSCYDDETQGIRGTSVVLMCCPNCSAPLAPKGRLTIVPEEPKTEFVCDTCGRVCKSKAGLAAHRRSHKGK